MHPGHKIVSEGKIATVFDDTFEITSWVWKGFSGGPVVKQGQGGKSVCFKCKHTYGVRGMSLFVGLIDYVNGHKKMDRLDAFSVQ